VSVIRFAQRKTLNEQTALGSNMIPPARREVHPSRRECGKKRWYPWKAGKTAGKFSGPSALSSNPWPRRALLPATPRKLLLVNRSQSGMLRALELIVFVRSVVNRQVSLVSVVI
jgi:hypothetical protein